MTPHEVNTIKDLLTSETYQPVSTGTLAHLAQRLGKVFASPTTWYRLIRTHQWRRPRQRVHPSKPKVGILASSPNEICHVYMTLIRLFDGSRAYGRAVINNFSRRILAWKVSATFATSAMAELFLSASIMGPNRETFDQFRFLARCRSVCWEVPDYGDQNSHTKVQNLLANSTGE